MRKILASLVVLAIASPVMAFPFTMTGAGPYVSDTTTPGAPNGSFTFAYGGPTFTAGNVSFSGTLTEVNTGTYASEARFCLTNPGGTRYCSSNLTATTNFTGTIAISNANVPFTTAAPTLPLGSVLAGSAANAGTWTAGFYESFNDSGIDSNWTNVSITVNDFVPPTPPVSTDLGSINPTNGILQGGGALAAGQVQWYKFTTTGVISTPNWLIAETLGSTLAGGSFPNDTEVGLYDSLGNLLVTNDDINFGGAVYTSRVWAGATPPAQTPAGGTAGPASLAAGTYYVAVGGYDTSFAANWTVTSTSLETGTTSLTIRTPEPTTIALLGIGALALIRRRR
jgi:hypothetical protein